MKVFKYDTVKLILNTGKDISGFGVMKIKYESPTGVKGTWTAAICPSSNLRIQATVQFNEVGIWKVQAYVKALGQVYHGLPADVRVFKPVANTTTVPPTTGIPTTTLTTGPPTTAGPTTVAPSTSVPSTSIPTTVAPTTAPPTTLAPTT